MATSGGLRLRAAHGQFLQGQAAGVAAALAVKDGVAVRRVDIKKVQGALKKAGVVIPH
jgi:hypothetical protein